MTKTPLEENNSDEWMVAVTTQELLDGIREKAMRIVSLHKMETCCSARRGHSPEGAEIDKTKKAKVIVRALHQVKAVERCGFEESNAKLEHEICRQCEESRVSVERIHYQ